MTEGIELHNQEKSQNALEIFGTILENLDVAKKGKPYERNLVSSNSSTKKHNKDQVHHNKKR